MIDVDKCIKEILEKVQYKSCNDLVTPPSVSTLDGTGVAVKVSCSNGWNVSQSVAHAQPGTMVVTGGYSDSGYKLAHEAYHHKCVANVAWDIWQGWPGGKSKWKSNSHYKGIMGSGWESWGAYVDNGWTCIWDATSVSTQDAKDWTAKYVHQCDAAAMDYSGSVGHGVWFDGKYWVSDTIQSDNGAVPGKNKTCSKFRVYRKPECKANSNSAGGEPKPITPSGKLSVEYRRTVVTEKYSYGKIFINGQYFCEACDVGTKGSKCPVSSSKTKPISGTYDLWFSKSGAFTNHANKPEKDYSYAIEYGYWYRNCKIGSDVYIPAIGSSDGACKDYKGGGHTGVRVHAGRGSINSACCIVLGTTGGKVIGDYFYFAKKNSNTSANETNERLDSIYKKHWDKYKEFWDMCYKLSGGQAKKIGTITLTMPQGF